MTASNTILVFGVYLMCLGLVGVLAPGVVTALLFLPTPTEPYFLIIAMIFVLLGYYYIHAARAQATGFFQATVVGRIAIGLVGVIFMIKSDLPFNLLPVFAIDAIAAVWTMRSLQAEGEAGFKLL